MESTSTIYTNSSNTTANITDRVVLQLLTQNNFNNDDDIFTFTDDNYNNTANGDVSTIPHTETVNLVEDEDEQEFEFPVMCTDSNLFQISPEFVSGGQISPRYPLFDRNLLTSDVDMDICNGVDSLMTESESKSKPKPSDGDINLCHGVNTSKTEVDNGVNILKTESKQPLAKQLSLMKLFDETRETTSDSSSETDDLAGLTPDTYCVWKPDLNPRGKQSKHKKSNSISIGNTSNRWKVRDLLKRSYSDDGYSTGKEKDSPVFIFIPPVSPEKVKQIGKTVKLKNIPAYKFTKTERNNPANKPYLPYREDQLAAYANFTAAKNG
ncbi:hypothetical protein HanHA300_Chr04g0122311 [Helianthus annuus]|nr:hypothetical protein HanHA300_Chr04g0122311 [Helianthus annuus]KAJ0929905.1 hypothetical protein HanPSC8_Chr04g0143171 [Helianthus annuus]